MDWQPLVEILSTSSLPIRQTSLHTRIMDYGIRTTRTIRHDRIIAILCRSVGLLRLVQQGALVVQSAFVSSEP
jgi:hypothetical protein